ncbi:MAG: hypothetical protein AAFR36_23145 [Bacteroidota bacterium]
MYAIQTLNKTQLSNFRKLAYAVESIALNIHETRLLICSNDPDLINRVREGYHFFEVEKPSPSSKRWFYLLGLSCDSKGYSKLMEDALQDKAIPPYCLVCPNYGKIYSIDNYGTLNFLTGVFFTGEMVARSNKEFLAVHGGGVAKDGVGVIFPAALRSGKTTLTLSFIFDGFKFSSDDVLLIHRKSLKIYPYPRLLSIRQGSLYIIPGLYKDYPKLYPSDVFGEPRWYLDKTEAVAEPFTCKMVAFPTLNQHSTSLSPIPKTQAALELIKHSFIPMTPTKSFTDHQEDLDTLSKFLEDTTTFRLNHWHPQESINMIKEKLFA